MRWFDRLTDLTVKWAGSATAVVLSVLLVVAWAAVGPFFEWSEAHQLFINTVTTILTFWMVFIIQHAVNKSEAAIQGKLDELIRSSNARNMYIGLDRRSEEEIEEARRE